MKIYENELYIREEVNGVTVFEEQSNMYCFYEGMVMDDFERVFSLEDCKAFLEKNKGKISRNIDFSVPFRVNWLIEERCNLDCIYCFADDKMLFEGSNRNIIETVDYILELGVINVGISGGEPTLNPYLTDIINRFEGKCSLSIDTNGTLPLLRENAELLQNLMY